MTKDKLLELIENVVEDRKKVNDIIAEKKKEKVLKGFKILIECSDYVDKFLPCIEKIVSGSESIVIPFKEIHNSSYGKVYLSFEYTLAYKGLYITNSCLNMTCNCNCFKEKYWLDIYSDEREYPIGSHAMARQMANELVDTTFSIENFKTKFDKFLEELINDYTKKTEDLKRMVE